MRSSLSGSPVVVVDILPIADSNEETIQLSDRIEGVAGDLSPFGQRRRLPAALPSPRADRAPDSRRPGGACPQARHRKGMNGPNVKETGATKVQNLDRPFHMSIQPIHHGDG
jgi:hypothetical protein